MKKALLLLMLLMIVLPSFASAEEYLYVMSKRAKLLSDPVFGSKTIDNLSKGEKMVNLEKQNNWFKVEYAGSVGWVSRLSVSAHPPLKRSRRIASNDNKLQENSRRRASTVSTTAAVRGLKEVERSRLNEKNTMDFAAVARMESLIIPDAEVYAFSDDISH